MKIISFFLYGVFSLYIKQRIEGKGFHRWKVILIKFTQSFDKNFVLIQPITKDFFVSFFEIKEKTKILLSNGLLDYNINIVNEQGNITKCDIEAPSYSSKAKTVFLEIKIDNIKQNDQYFFLKISFPFHFRYTKPVLGRKKHNEIIFPSCLILKNNFCFKEEKLTYIKIPSGEKNFFISIITNFSIISGFFIIIAFLILY